MRIPNARRVWAQWYITPAKQGLIPLRRKKMVMSKRRYPSCR